MRAHDNAGFRFRNGILPLLRNSHFLSGVPGVPAGGAEKRRPGRYENRSRPKRTHRRGRRLRRLLRHGGVPRGMLKGAGIHGEMGLRQRLQALRSRAGMAAEGFRSVLWEAHRRYPQAKRRGKLGIPPDSLHFTDTLPARLEHGAEIAGILPGYPEALSLKGRAIRFPGVHLRILQGAVRQLPGAADADGGDPGALRERRQRALHRRCASGPRNLPVRGGELPAGA